MENCAFIDIFTTQNDLYGKNNCPIQFCCEVYSNEEFFDEEKFNKPQRRIIFNIIPDENIMVSGYLNSGFKTEDIKTSDFNGVELKQAMEKIYKLLKSFKDKNLYIIGYNHIFYDLEILNKTFKRVLDFEPIEFDDEKLIDVMKLVENTISVDKIGNYTLESVFTYFNNDCNKIQAFRNLKSTSTDIKITKMILKEYLKSGMKFSDVKRIESEIKPVDIISFGKYKGALLSFVFENDKQYCNWILKNKDMMNKYPAIVESIKKMYNTVE